MGEVIRASNVIWYRGLEVRFNGTDLLEFFVRDLHERGDPLNVRRRRILRTKGKPKDLAEHVRKRVNAYWFEFEHKRAAGSDGVAMDGLPWEMHRIHNHVARAAATHAYLYDHEVIVSSCVIMGYNVVDWAPFHERVPVQTMTTISFPTGDLCEPRYSR